MDWLIGFVTWLLGVIPNGLRRLRERNARTARSRYPYSAASQRAVAPPGVERLPELLREKRLRSPNLWEGEATLMCLADLYLEASKAKDYGEALILAGAYDPISADEWHLCSGFGSPQHRAELGVRLRRAGRGREVDKLEKAHEAKQRAAKP